MFHKNRRDLIAIFITSLIVFETIVYVSTTPRPQEQFFQFYVLGAYHTASNYYPGNNSLIQRGTMIRWYLGVANNMGNVQLVALRVKLGNQTIASPDDSNSFPSPAPLIVEFDRFIENNGTWEAPFFWSISNVTVAQATTRILELVINNETYSAQGSSAIGGYSFRLIFELWTWDLGSQGLQFGWFAGNEHRVAWLQIWFNVTTTAPT